MFPTGDGVPAVPTQLTEVEQAMLYFLSPTVFPSLPISDSQDSIISKSV